MHLSARNTFHSRRQKKKKRKSPKTPGNMKRWERSSRSRSVCRAREARKNGIENRQHCCWGRKNPTESSSYFMKSDACVFTIGAANGERRGFLRRCTPPCPKLYNTIISFSNTSNLMVGAFYVISFPRPTFILYINFFFI